MDQLKEGVGLRSFAQRDPLIEFKKEGEILVVQRSDNLKNYKIKTAVEEIKIIWI